MSNICTCIIRILDGGPESMIEALEGAKTIEEAFQAIHPCSSPEEFENTYGAFPYYGEPYIVRATVMNQDLTEVMFFTRNKFPWRILNMLHQHGCKFEAGSIEEGMAEFGYWHNIGGEVVGQNQNLPQTPAEALMLPFGGVLLMDVFEEMFGFEIGIPEEIQKVLPAGIVPTFEEFVGSEELPSGVMEIEEPSPEEIVEDLCDYCNCDIDRSYSGRGMYGATCYAIICREGVSEQEIVEKAAAKGLTGARVDSLGLGSVVYWPNIGRREVSE